MTTKVLTMIGILIIAFAAMVAPVMAATSAKPATITGNPAAVITLETPAAAIAFDSMVPGSDATYTQADSWVKVTSNYETWGITATDAQGNTLPGYMYEWDGAAYTTTHLTDAMKLTAGAHAGVTPAAQFTVDDTEKDFADGTGTPAALDTISIPLLISQHIENTDPVLASNNYQIIVRFTGTVP